MKLNELAISTFESNYMKDYLTSIGHKFTAEEIVTIILNANMAMDTKISIINRMLDTNEIEEYSSADIEKLHSEIKLINMDYDYITKACCGAYNSIFVYTEYDEESDYEEKKCFISLGALKKKAVELGNSLDLSVTICDGNTSEDVIYLELDKDGNIEHYRLCQPINGKISELYDKYVYIPTELQMGDIVKAVGSPEEYIVVNPVNRTITCLNNMAKYSTDSSVIVIPKEEMHDTSDYKKQVQNILELRIIALDKAEDMDIYNDNIIHQENLHLTLVEKVGSKE